MAGQLRTAELIPSTQPAVRVSSLCKRYGELEAVRDVDFDVAKGEIFGLIGPDGAGKTSTLQILAGVMSATDGEALVFGEPARDARLHSGYLTQSFTLYPDLTVMENVRYVGDLRLTPPREIHDRGMRYLEMFGMAKFADRLAEQLSGGMKQKLALTCALVSEPDILLLDEPTTGVDPVSRREFWDALVHLSADGLTILVATPYLDEAERCHRVAFMHLGRVRQLGTPDELRQSLGAMRLELRVSDLRAASAALPRTPPIIDVQRFGDRLDVLTPDPDGARAIVEKTLDAAGITVQEVRVDEPLLENVFVASMRLAEPSSESVFPAQRSRSTTEGDVAIGADRLTRRFGDFTAVDCVSVRIRYGEIYGLLGANGAGKTTTIKMLCGLLDPTEGTVQLAGAGEKFRSADVRQRIGYMSQKFSLYDDLAIVENLEFFAGIYGLPHEASVKKIRWVLEFSGLRGKEREITGQLPGGWKQRVAFGSAIMHEPTVIFLDEPTSGVDPLARRALWGLIQQLADNGAAVLVTTHYLEEADQCNRLGFMIDGKLAVEGTPSEIRARQQGHLLELRVDQPQKALDALAAQRWDASLFGERLHVTVDDIAVGEPDLKQALERNGVQVSTVREVRFSLEDAFIAAVGQSR
jgi:ABC-2 type transport system ATP-binding protein